MVSDRDEAWQSALTTAVLLLAAAAGLVLVTGHLATWMFEHGWLMLFEGEMTKDLPPGYLAKIVSHRHLRYGSGVLHLALLGSSFMLVRRGGAYRLAWLGQLAFLAEAARRPGLARYYTLVTWGTVESLVNYLDRGVPAVWVRISAS